MKNPALIRNISIIAHIDHGKTTLTDRMMLATKTITEREFRDRLLDSNPIEQERGITIKLAPVTMDYSYQDQDYQINLIDTPGHVDFAYEVSRSLAACEGAVLLVDTTQGIQAQTLSTFHKAKDLGLKIIVALNKVDLPSADIDSVTLDVMESLGIEDLDDIIPISAKSGQNVDALMNRVIEVIPSPQVSESKIPRGLVFNSVYDTHKGVVAFVKLVDGKLEAGQELKFLASGRTLEAREIGIFTPQMKSVDNLTLGQVGYVATGLKDVALIKAGDTLTYQETATAVMPLPGYKEPQSMVYMDLFPVDGDEFATLTDAIEKISLNDAALQSSKVHSLALGNGYRVGFLGVLHAEVVLERLKREFSLELIPTSPTVIYKVDLASGDQIEVRNPSELPDPSLIKQIYEPIAKVTVFSPEDYLGGIMQLSTDSRGILLDQQYIGTRVKLDYKIPLSELIVTYFDQLKSVSQGYASLEYEIDTYQPVDAVKLSLLVNKEPVEALSQIVYRGHAREVGKRVVKKLHENIPRQLYAIPIQAAVGGDVVARETVKPFRKDVTAKLYGGDITRRKKLLEKQKKGKAKRSQFAKVEIPQEAYLAVLKQ